MGFWISRRADRCAMVPARWAECYDGSRDPRKAEIGEKLKALPASDLRPEVIDEIIGNDTWTSHRCDECDEQFELLVGIAANGMAPCEAMMLLCEDCISSALQLIKGQEEWD